MLDSKNKEDFLFQQDIKELLNHEFESDNWLVVYHQIKDEYQNVGFFSALIPNDAASSVLQEDSWDISIGDGGPEVCVSIEDDEEIWEYHSYTEKGNIQPIVIVRFFHSIRPSYIEIQEEFRLFHNLYYDEAKGKYIKIHSDGNEEDIIIVEDETVRIRTRALREYAAIKDFSIVLYVDSIRYSPISLDQVPESQRHLRECHDNMSYIVHINENISRSPKEKTSSLFIGKRIIKALPKEKCRIWPYDEESEGYESFIVGLDDEGDPIMYTSDPEKLDGPSAYDYLTPTFFRREVLNKYYSQPQKFRVSDGHLWCGDLWALRMDNNHPEYIVVWLGDLGKDLPYGEQVYWKTFNIPPEGSVSRTCYTRHIMGEFADPESPDLRFEQELSEFKKRWQEKHGWPLLLELDQKDQHLLTALHVPTTGDQAEFDGQVLSLTKILIDSLNEAELTKRISGSTSSAKGIDKLQMFLQESGNQESDKIISFLRDLQALRSTGVGHRKGKKYEKIAQRFGLNSSNLQQAFSDILANATSILISLIDESHISH